MTPGRLSWWAKIIAVVVMIFSIASVIMSVCQIAVNPWPQLIFRALGGVFQLFNTLNCYEWLTGNIVFKYTSIHKAYGSYRDYMKHEYGMEE